MLACHVTIIPETQGKRKTITWADASSSSAIGEASARSSEATQKAPIVAGPSCKVVPMSLIRQSCFVRDRMRPHNDTPADEVRPFGTRMRRELAVYEGGGRLYSKNLKHARHVREIRPAIVGLWRKVRTPKASRNLIRGP